MNAHRTVLMLSAALLACGGEEESSSLEMSGDIGTVDSSDSEDEFEPANDAPVKQAEPPAEGAAGGCDAGICVPAAPQGWFGPVARVELSENPTQREGTACGGDFPVSVAAGFTELEVPEATCECSCGEPEGGECSSELNVNFFPVNCTEEVDRMCTAATGQNADGCENGAERSSSRQVTSAVMSRANAVRVLVDPLEVIRSPVCEAALDQQIPPPVLSTFVELCAPEQQPGSCATEETCFPTTSQPFGSQACIWTQGSAECPGEIYTEELSLAEGVQDSRSCSECSCRAAEEVSCEVGYGIGELVSTSASSDQFRELGWRGGAGVPGFGICSDIFMSRTVPAGETGSFTAAIAVSRRGTESSGCSPIGGELTGEVTWTDTITVCCEPEGDQSPSTTRR